MIYNNVSLSKRSSLLFVAAVLATSAATAAGTHGGGHNESPIGEPGVASKASRTIQVDAADNMRFPPEVARGGCVG